VRKLPRSQWSVFIPNHHEGFIDMTTYEANRARITANTHPRPHQPSGGAVREGSALLQGLAVCGHCGRKLRTRGTFGILNRQERRTAYGHRFTANLVGSLRRSWDIPRFEPPAVPPPGERMNIKQAAAALGVAGSTVHRWLHEGIIAGQKPQLAGLV
jgi:hypothetical protein